MVNKTETTFLLNKKVNHEGKSYNTAYSEINKLNGFEYDLKRKNNEIKILKSRLEKANIIIIDLKEKNKLEKQKYLLKKLDQPEKQGDNGNLNYLRRIIRNIIPGIEYTQTDISTEFCIDNKKTKDYLSFLKEINFIDLKKDEKEVIKYFEK